MRQPEIHTVSGMNVLIDETHDRVPRMTVSPRFAELMPPEFVADLNSWMVSFFGTQRAMFRIGDHTLVMGPRTWADIQAAAARRW